MRFIVETNILKGAYLKIHLKFVDVYIIEIHFYL